MTKAAIMVRSSETSRSTEASRSARNEDRLSQSLPAVRIKVPLASQWEDLSAGLRELGFDVCFAAERLNGNEVVLVQEELLGSTDDTQPFLVIGRAGSVRAAETAIDRGSSGYFAAPFEFLALGTAICAADVRARASAGLQEHLGTLQEAMQTDQMVSTVVGILMERFRLQRPEAHARLRKYSRRERRKMVELANELILASDELEHTMRAFRPTSRDD